ncbi:hypothetical protein J2X16_003769 [Pelomonas aquatica]|uniref:DUF1360 domain-containing protein n=1 Tax=Pelomonas aquatica TaxID=431058 RepID=A0ABU1ZCP7_9BURK|nr:hypothetical protein [Pelomonas aquatica]MDR7298406.1 hypothetical protein [Pelomonas aquatica]
MDAEIAWWRLLVAALATWRLAHLLVVEDGPFDLAARLRAGLGAGALGRALDCIHCTSLWLAAPLACFVTTEPALWWAVWLALSGAAGLAHRATEPPVTLQALQGETDELLWTGPRPGAEPAGREPEPPDTASHALRRGTATAEPDAAARFDGPRA